MLIIPGSLLNGQHYTVNCWLDCIQHSQLESLVLDLSKIKQIYDTCVSNPLNSQRMLKFLFHVNLRPLVVLIRKNSQRLSWLVHYEVACEFEAVCRVHLHAHVVVAGCFPHYREWVCFYLPQLAVDRQIWTCQELDYVRAVGLGTIMVGWPTRKHNRADILITSIELARGSSLVPHNLQVIAYEEVIIALAGELLVLT